MALFPFPVSSKRNLLVPTLFLCGVAVCYGSLTLTDQIWKCPEQSARANAETSAANPRECSGRTQPVPGRSATIAPAVLHPVEEVLVKPGDRVTKGQILVKLDDDEPQADVRAKHAVVAEMKASLARFKAQPREEERAEARALLDSTRLSLTEARRFMARVEGLWVSGASSEKHYFETLANLARLEADEKAGIARLERLLKQPLDQELAELAAKIAAAEANLQAAIAELEHYTVRAPGDGVVTRLEVNAGMVSRPGTTSWGDILDLREMDVRCDLTAKQADTLKLAQTAEVYVEGFPDRLWLGSIVLIGLAANQEGRIPVLIRVQNPQESLGCYVEVRVRFLR